MSVIKFIRDVERYFKYPSDDNPTTQQDYQEAVKNWIETEKNIVDTLLWQPETEYSVGNIVKTPSLPSQTYLVCIVAGTSGTNEPDYSQTDVGDIIADGTTNWIVQPVSDVPAGVVQAYAGTTTPYGWLLCDGSAVSREDYASLYSVIGDTYGAGDGSTTFNLPNLVDKFVEGSDTSGTVKSAGLPNITGDFSTRGLSVSTSFIFDASGAISNVPGDSAYNTVTATNASSNRRNIGFNASRSNSIYGNSTTVQPPALTMRYIIKY